jgi:hypothetical protein
MRRLTHVIFVILLAVLILCAAFAVMATGTGRRLRKKAADAEAGVRILASHGGDPSPIVAVMQEVKPALDAGDPRKAEALLDRALSLLSQAEPLPVYTGPETESGLYGRPEPVVISGYDGSAMEPFISPDGHYLFFNNENDPKVDTNLHFAERTGKLSFRYRGELPGVNSAALDAVASIDTAGHFYFTTLREYDRTMNSIYTGDFDGHRVSNVHAVPGDISPKTPGTVNMDASISPDGQTLYISRAVIFPGAPAPAKSDLLIARLKDGAFHIDPGSARIMKNINTGALEYAPAISADGRELFFTRASQSSVRIMVAARTSDDVPFGEPRVLRALSGFVEAPSISLDEKEMFYHKKVGDRFAIYRAERRVE